VPADAVALQVFVDAHRLIAAALFAEPVFAGQGLSRIMLAAPHAHSFLRHLVDALVEPSGVFHTKNQIEA